MQYRMNMNFAYILAISLYLSVSINAYATTYEFDDDGNLISHEAVDFRYDENHKPVASITTSSVKREIIDAEFLELLVAGASAKHDVDDALIKAVIKAESSNDIIAVSPKGAQGLMQLMPKTAKRFGVEDSFNPAENIDGGVKYLKWLLERFEGNEELTLAAYNAGEKKVEEYNGVPPYPETQNYIKRIRSYLKRDLNV